MANTQSTQHEVSPIEIQKYLGGVDYPASKESLLTTARQHKAPAGVIDALQKLRRNEFDGPSAVMKAYGETRH